MWAEAPRWEQGVIRRVIEQKQIHSMILGTSEWENYTRLPIAEEPNPFVLSAINSGGKIFVVIDQAEQSSQQALLLSMRFTVSASLSKIHCWVPWRRTVTLIGNNGKSSLR